MNPPSEELKRGLERLKLATDRDLLGCRSRVRRLAHGLPAFDSVWIDALIQSGKLTPFQSRFIEQRRFSELEITDGIILTDQIHFDPVMPVYTAKNPESNQRYFVSRVHISQVESQAALKRLNELIPQSSKHDAQYALPHSIQFNQKQNILSVISPYESGESLDRLMIRRGRFPEEVVRAIAVGLCEELIRNEVQVLHGDLRLANIWLTPTGQVRLINGRIFPAISPFPTIHTPLPSGAYDGLAPERYESAQPISVATDIYAIGCMLWQLLAGRPPFTLSDPLAKIAAHRQKAIPDVREVAPETSLEFAEVIGAMTQKLPSKRPADLIIVKEMIAKTVRKPASRLQQFIQSFESAAPRHLGHQRKNRSALPYQISAALVLSVIVSVAVWNRDRLGFPQLNSVSAIEEKVSPLEFQPLEPVEQETEVAEAIEEPTESLSNEPELLELPLPDAMGVVLLDQSQKYQARSIEVAQALILRGAEGASPIVVIDGSQSLLRGSEVTFENLQLEFTNTDAVSDEAILKVEADEFHLRGCSIRNAAEQASPLISWSAFNPSSVSSGRLLITNTICDTTSTMMDVKTSLTTALFENVLKTKNGPILNLYSGVRSGLQVPVVMNRCTFAGEGPVFLVDQIQKISESGLFSLQGQNSIFGTSPNQPLIGFYGSELPTGWENHFEISAQGLIVQQDALLMGQRETTDAAWRPVPTTNMRVDGLVSGAFRFEAIPTRLDSEISIPKVIIEDLPIRVSAEAPGFDSEFF